ncbi:hypothetical protein HK101_009360 [Irineochytrium annulatum]|nr:hypothetical protein HK101_009360 [Irineochytrium annulatum]
MTDFAGVFGNQGSRASRPAFQRLLETALEEVRRGAENLARGKRRRATPFFKSYEDIDHTNEQEEPEDDQAEELEEPVQHAVLSDASRLREVTSAILTGAWTPELASYNEVVNLLSPPARVLLFVSSTFTDTAWERNTAIEDVYPYLRSICEALDMTFETVDMRWGVLDQSTAEHLTSELCLRQLQKCLDESAGPAFFSILGNKYGYRPFPSRIDSVEFNRLASSLENLALMSPADVTAKVGATLLEKDGDSTGLLRKWRRIHYWFKPDTNTDPPTHYLVPSIGKGRWDRDGRTMVWGRLLERAIRKHLTVGITKTSILPAASIAAAVDVDCGIIMDLMRGYLIPRLENDWDEDQWNFMRLLRAAAWDMEPVVKRKYVQSVTEDEVMHGLTRPDKFIGFQRNLVGLLDDATTACATKNNAQCDIDGKFIDILWSRPQGFTGVDMDAVSELTDLKRRIIPRPLETFDVPWLGGFEPLKNADHGAYVARFCDLMCSALAQGILDADAHRYRVREWDPLVYEAYEHWRFARDLARFVAGKKLIPPKVLLSKVFHHLRKVGGGGVCVIEGPPGSGKTCLMASIAEHAREGLGRKDVVVVQRFAGTTTDSSDPASLSRSVCAQILRAYHEDPRKAFFTLAEKVDDVVRMQDRDPISKDAWFLEMGKHYCASGFLPEYLGYDYIQIFFPACLLMATEERPLLLVFDGLDVLIKDDDDFGRSLSWLPSPLPDNVWLVVSALDKASETRVEEESHHQKVAAQLKEHSPDSFVFVTGMAGNEHNLRTVVEYNNLKVLAGLPANGKESFHLNLSNLISASHLVITHSIEPTSTARSAVSALRMRLEPPPPPPSVVRDFSEDAGCRPSWRQNGRVSTGSAPSSPLESPRTPDFSERESCVAMSRGGGGSRRSSRTWKEWFEGMGRRGSTVAESNVETEKARAEKAKAERTAGLLDNVLSGDQELMTEKNVLVLIDGLHHIHTEIDDFIKALSISLPKTATVVCSLLQDHAAPHHHTSTRTVSERLHDRFNPTSSLDSHILTVPIPTLTRHQVDVLLDSLLVGGERNVTASQRDELRTRAEACPLPLYLHLAWREARTWRSDSVPELGSDVVEELTRVFATLEARHGALLVSHSLGYITIAKRGLSSAELEDVLSLDDEVLSKVYQYWTPPVRRIPSALWIRIRDDIGDLLLERGRDKIVVYDWHHDQVRDFIHERYCSDLVEVQKLHSILADFFSGRYATEPKPYLKLQKHGPPIEMSALRFVRPQPFNGRQTNVRRVGSQAWHLIDAHRLSDAVGVLTDIAFVREANAAQLINDTLLCYRHALSHPILSKADRIRMREFEAFLVSNLSGLSNSMGRGRLISFAANYPDSTLVMSAARDWVASDRDWMWTDVLSRPAKGEQPSPLATLLESGGMGLQVTSADAIGDRVAIVGLYPHYVRVVTLWDITTGRRVGKVELPLEPWTDRSDPPDLHCRFSKGGDQIAVCGCEVFVVKILQVGEEWTDMDLVVKRAPGAGKLPVEVEAGELGSVSACTGKLNWSADDAYLAVSYIMDDWSLWEARLYNSSTLDLVARFSPADFGFESLLWRLGSRSFAIYGKGNDVHCLDVSEWARTQAEGAAAPMTVAATLDGPLGFDFPERCSVALDDRQRLLVLSSAADNERPKKWRLIDLKRGGELLTEIPAPAGVTSSALSPDGSYLTFTVQNAKDVVVYEVPDIGDPVGRKKLEAGDLNVFFTAIRAGNNFRFGPFQEMNVTGFTSDGKHLLTDASNFAVSVWACEHGFERKRDKYKRPWNAPKLAMHSCAVQPSTWLVQGGFGTIYVLDENGRRVGAPLPLCEHGVENVIPPPDGEEDHYAFDVIADLVGHSTRPLALAITPSGRAFLINLEDPSNPRVNQVTDAETDREAPHLTSCFFVMGGCKGDSEIRFMTGDSLAGAKLWTYDVTRGGKAGVLKTLTIPDARPISRVAASVDGTTYAAVLLSMPTCVIWRWGTGADDDGSDGSDARLRMIFLDQPQVDCGEAEFGLIRPAFHPSRSDVIALSGNTSCTCQCVYIYNVDHEAADGEDASTVMALPVVTDRITAMEWSAEGEFLSLSRKSGPMVFKVDLDAAVEEGVEEGSDRDASDDEAGADAAENSASDDGVMDDTVVAGDPANNDASSNGGEETEEKEVVNSEPSAAVGMEVDNQPATEEKTTVTDANKEDELEGEVMVEDPQALEGGNGQKQTRYLAGRLYTDYPNVVEGTQIQQPVSVCYRPGGKQNLMVDLSGEVTVVCLQGRWSTSNPHFVSKVAEGWLDEANSEAALVGDWDSSRLPDIANAVPVVVDDLEHWLTGFDCGLRGRLIFWGVLELEEGQNGEGGEGTDGVDVATEVDTAKMTARVKGYEEVFAGVEEVNFDCDTRPGHDWMGIRGFQRKILRSEIDAVVASGELKVRLGRIDVFSESSTFKKNPTNLFSKYWVGYRAVIAESYKVYRL